MKKILLLLLLLVTFSINFSEIKDNIGILEEEDVIALDERIKGFENEFNVKFIVEITDNQEKTNRIAQNAKNTVFLNIIKPENEKRIISRLYFTKDIDILGYKDEMDSMMNKSEKLITKGKYVDYIFEIIGYTAETVSVITSDKNATYENTLRNTIFAIVALFILLFIAYRVTKSYLKRLMNKTPKCKSCKIDMDMVDEYVESNKLVKLYNCHVCGTSKKISFRD